MERKVINITSTEKAEEKVGICLRFHVQDVLCADTHSNPIQSHSQTPSSLIELLIVSSIS